MKGSIFLREEWGTGVWGVYWYYKGRTRPIYRDRFGYFFRTHLDEKKCHGRERAIQLLTQMRQDDRDKTFRWDKYTGLEPTNVIRYLWEWLDAIEGTLKPATYKDYHNSIKNHLSPFFETNPCELHEIQLDTLTKLMKSIDRVGKGKLNVMYCLHACLDFAWRSNKIHAVPPFPKRKEYKIPKRVPRWLPEVRQDAVINAIPKEHQPIFWWLKYHVRRPGEACALLKRDYDPQEDAFFVCRTLSNRQFVNATKTGEEHETPCHFAFKPIMKAMPKIISPYFFINPNGRLPGRPYQLYVLERLWNQACQYVGEEKITMYMGLKHSRCSQMKNEWGYSDEQIQAVTDHARIESVRIYSKTEMATKRALMEGKIVDISGRTGIKNG